MIKNEKFEDLTNLFLQLQDEIVPVGIGEKTSLQAQLQDLVSDLRHLFLNADHLITCLNTGGLTYEHAFLKRTEKWSKLHLPKLLEEYRSAKLINEPRLYTVLADFQQFSSSAYQHVVSIAELSLDKKSMKAPVFVKSCMRDLGDLMESSLFPFLRLRLKVLHIGKKIKITDRDIDDLSLGTTIAKISSIHPDLYCPEPFNISLSQWRNISYHSNYKVFGDIIRCEYRKKGHKKEFECSPNQLLEICRYVNDTYYLHKVANEIFCTDNINNIAKAINRENVKIEMSEFTTDATMAYSVVASGFRILHAARKDYRWAFVLRDLHNRGKEDIKTALQKSLIPYLLQIGQAEVNAMVETQTKKHSISFRSEIKSSDDYVNYGYNSFKLGRNFSIDE